MIYFAFLRGVNVGGNKKVSMADLRSMLSEMGLKDGRTVLQSGNLVFSSEGSTCAVLEVRLQKELVERLGLKSEVLVRDQNELREVVAHNPFPEEAKTDPSHLVVMFLRGAPSGEQVEALRSAIKGRERVEARGRVLYAVYPDGIGDSKLTIGVMESKLGCQGTGRNWNTVGKLLAI